MKLFVTDIDDTLSVGESVAPAVQDACRRLREGGWEIMIATGRTLGTARRHIRSACASQPAILYDGGRTMRQDGTELRSVIFDEDLAGELLKYSWELPAEIQVTGDEYIYCRHSDRETDLFYREAGVPVHYIDNPSVPGPVYRIGLWLKPHRLQALEETFTTDFGGKIEITAGGNAFLDLLPTGVSKGSALRDFISSLPQRPEVIVAAGDHRNDVEMLRYADVAAAPRNAAPEILASADLVMPRADELGMCALVDHLLSPAFRVPQQGADVVYLPDVELEDRQ